MALPIKILFTVETTPAILAAEGILGGVCDVQQITGPLGSKNRLKLATFASNTEGINAGPPLTWAETLWAAQFVDRIGFEAVVPVSRWRGETGQRSFDTMCWASAMAALTHRAAIFTTVDMGIVHPVMAAKQIAAIDHISGGRAAANVVAGWYKAEAEMFGSELIDHDTRYDRADEWTKIVLDLWTSEEFQELNFKGDFYTVKEGFLSPQPVQEPRPVLMNAGSSPRAHEYIARNVDITFAPGIQLADVEAGAAQIKALKDKAAAFGRELQVFTFLALFAADTEEQAERELTEYRDEHYNTEERQKYFKTMERDSRVLQGAGDWNAAMNRTLGLALAVRGTPETVVEQFKTLNAMGLDGLLLTWPEWRHALPYFEREILPRLEQAGLREPLVAAAAHGDTDDAGAETRYASRI